MKIYPGTSSIISTKEVNLETDVVLCNINTNASEYTHNTSITEDMKTKYKKEVLPYSVIRDKEFICLFDKDEKQIDYETLSKSFVRSGNDYIYMPFGSRVFRPNTFEYSVLAKKGILYSAKSQYNLEVRTLNNNWLAHKLMPIFGDAPSRLTAPANIHVNDGDLSLKSLTANEITDSSITFVLLENEATALENAPKTRDFSKVKFDKNSLIEKNNLNIIGLFKVANAIKDKDNIDEKKVNLVNMLEDKTFKLNDLDIFNEIEYTTKFAFTVPRRTPKGIKYINIFNNDYCTPFLIEEHEGKGFFAYATDEIINAIKDNSKVMYEIMFKLYSKGYIRTETIKEWIADVMPDFIIENEKLIKREKFISNLEISKMLMVNENEASPYTVDINKEKYPFVDFVGIEKNYLVFKKNTEGSNSIYLDPPKPEGAISIYTSKGTIIYYDKFIYSIRDSVSDVLQIEKRENDIIVNLKPYRNSDLGLYIPSVKEPLQISLSEIINNQEVFIKDKNFFLIAKPNKSVSFYELIETSKYEEKDGIILAQILIKESNTAKEIYDMRRRGGGLQVGEKDVFDCFDIGHLYGKAYRKAGASIITLPKYLEKHKDLIREIILKHTVGTDYPVLIFKGEK